GGAAPSVAFTLDDRPYPSAAEVRPLAEGRGWSWVLRDVPARGGRFVAELIAGDEPISHRLDRRAAVVLPDRPLIRVALSPALAPRLGSLLAADPGVVVASAECDVAIGLHDDVPTGVPTLRFVPDAQEDAFSIGSDVEGSDDSMLRDAFFSLGLEHIDAQALAEEFDRPIRLDVHRTPTRDIAVWESLLSEEFDFVGSKSFPVFIARALRFLTDAEPLLSFAVAGEPVDSDITAWSVSRPDRSTTLDAVGASFVPPRAGSYASGDRRLSVSLGTLEPFSAKGPDRAPSVAPADRSSFPLWSVLALLAFALLGVEWWAFHRGRMP
ncbi:MAG: hypothetical protein KDC38_17870, partial [Planctomycetes bacterium]|nr:hypothetical protein [Planctomycetota bacterium]